jgi:cyanophycinase
MGGGTDLDEAFQWLCERAGGGDLLVLRATGKDDYNPYIRKLCHLNSVATVVIPDRAAAEDQFVAQAIGHASALFISGGDQANYINFWQGTRVQTAINEAIRRGVPIGGTSAGLAVLGEYAYTAQGDKPDDPNLDGKLAMADPYGPRITISHNFLEIPVLKGIITDTHFAKRDRMGRLLVFLALLNEPDGKPMPPPGENIRGIGVEQGAAVLLELDGKATVVGHGCAYFVDAQHASGGMIGAKFGVMTLHQPLTFGDFAVQKVAPGHAFDLKAWTGDAIQYELSIEAGIIHSTQSGGAVY